MPSRTQSTQQDQEGKAATPIIDNILAILKTLIGYARQLENTPYLNAAHPNFQKFAVAWGTHDIRHILAQVRRGLLRALALEKYLQARVDKGRDIKPAPVPTRAEPADVAGMAFNVPDQSRSQSKSTRHPHTYPARQPPHDFDDPLYFSNPTAWELHAWLRKYPVGRLLAEICADLGITPGTTVRETFQHIADALHDLDHGQGEAWYYATKERRRVRVAEHLAYATGGWRHNVLEGDTRRLVRDLLGFVCGDALPSDTG